MLFFVVLYDQTVLFFIAGYNQTMLFLAQPINQFVMVNETSRPVPKITRKILKLPKPGDLT